MNAGKVMSLEVTAVPPELMLEQAHRLMLKLDVRHLPVVAHGKLAGILSDRDILLKVGRRSDGELLYPEITAGEVMSLSPMSAGINTPISRLATAMIAGKIDAVPIVSRDDELIGLVTSSDLLGLLRELPDDSLPMLSFQLRRVEPDFRA